MCPTSCFDLHYEFEFLGLESSFSLSNMNNRWSNLLKKNKLYTTETHKTKHYNFLRFTLYSQVYHQVKHNSFYFAQCSDAVEKHDSHRFYQISWLI